MMKKLLLTALALIGLLIVAVLVVPPFIDFGAYKERYLPLVEEALQRKVDVKEVRLRILPNPAIRISALSLSDNPAFSKDPFFTAEQLKLQLRFWPLLKGELRVDEFVLERPVMRLLRQADGSFNFADIAKKQDASKKKTAEPGKRRDRPDLAGLIPARLRLEGGEIAFQAKGQEPIIIRGVDISLEDFAADRPFPYRIALRPPGLKAITLAGRLSYEADAAAVKLVENKLRAQEVEFSVEGAITDLSGVPRVHLTLDNPGFETRPIFELLSNAGLVSKELAISGPMGLRLALTGPSHSLASALNVELKDIKISDKRAFDGAVTGQILLALPLGGQAPPVQTLSGSGKLAARDGKFTSVDLISKIQLITGLIGLPKEQSSGATTFKTLETDFKLAGGIAEIERLYLSNPLMEVTGAGRITLAAQSLDLALEAALAPEVSARAGSGKAATFLKDSQGRIIVPLRITGPIKEPSVMLDAGKVVKKGLGQLFEQFFRRR